MLDVAMGVVCVVFSSFQISGPSVAQYMDIWTDMVFSKTNLCLM